MSVRFGTDGTLYCNTVRYNYKQVRNLIADNTGDQTSGAWSLNGTSSAVVAGSKTYRAWKLSMTNAYTLGQTLPALYSGHVYYFGCMLQSNNVEEFRVRIANIDLPATQINSGGNWVKWSVRFTSTSNTTGSFSCGGWKASEGNLYVTRFIFIDLTDAFGSGNEPTKEWCDNNIREWDTYINVGYLLYPGTPSPAVTMNNMSTVFSPVNQDWILYNYLSDDNSNSPRDYIYTLVPKTTFPEAHIYTSGNVNINTAHMYYFKIEYRTDNPNGSVDVYVPEAEPLLGTAPLIPDWNSPGFNGGGGMTKWKRLSIYGSRTAFSTGNYQMRIDYNNYYSDKWIYLTGICMSDLDNTLRYYNSINGTSFTTADINKEWCDRWLDGRGSEIIHIKNPYDTTIKFNTSYDVVCNDIEIHPEVNTITCDKTGTIICKKLVRSQAY